MQGKGADFMAYDKKIDFHAHILSPSYYDYLDQYEGPTPDNFATPKWSEEAHLKLMDKLGVAFSMMTVSSPHVIHAKDITETMAFVNGMNDEALDVVRRHPDKLGMCAILPLPHVKESIATAKKYLEEEGCYGIGMTTHYNGIYLGSDELDPVLEFLNKKKALVVVHPTEPAALPGNAMPDMPIPIMDFLMDTTRAFTNMVWNDKFLKYPDIKWVWPHGASFMNILSDRMLAHKEGNKNKLDYFGALKNCWFDTAGFSATKQLHDMKMDIPMDHFLYGSDCPYTPNIACIGLVGQLEASKELSRKEKKMMFTDNALELVPELKSKKLHSNAGMADHLKSKAVGKALTIERKLH